MSKSSGELTIPLGGDRTFRLTGRADRIERLADGRYAILDFKTGHVPSDKQVQIGVAPQLTLEGAMLRSGGFARDRRSCRVARRARLCEAQGRRAGRAKNHVIAFKGSSPDAAAEAARARLTALVTRFEDETTPYRSLVLSMWTHRYGTYDDLARVKEWSLAGGLEEVET